MKVFVLNFNLYDLKKKHECTAAQTGAFQKEEEERKSL